MDLAYEVLSGGLLSIARREWAVKSPIGIARVSRIAAALELGRRVVSLDATTGEPVEDPGRLATTLISRYGHCVQERLDAIFLDSRKRVLREREIYVGTLTSANVSTRDVFRSALEENAASIIVSHNHPSGDPSPSMDDIAFTRQLVEISRALNVPVVDHLVIASCRYFSLREHGLL